MSFLDVFRVVYLGDQLNPGDFYTLNFSNNHTLTFSQQGHELRNAITAVLRANPTKSKVILVAHSMGGLAARAYLQGKADTFREDVAALITVGTPHQGSMEAKNCNLNAVACRAAGKNPNSVAMNALIPNKPRKSAPVLVLRHFYMASAAVVSF